GMEIGLEKSIRGIVRKAEQLAMAAVPGIHTPASIGYAAGSAMSRSNDRGDSTTTIKQRDIHLHVGTLVADKQGLKQLERKLRSIRIEENSRIGDDLS